MIEDGFLSITYSKLWVEWIFIFCWFCYTTDDRPISCKYKDKLSISASSRGDGEKVPSLRGQLHWLLFLAEKRHARMKLETRSMLLKLLDWREGSRGWHIGRGQLLHSSYCENENLFWSECSIFVKFCNSENFLLYGTLGCCLLHSIRLCRCFSSLLRLQCYNEPALHQSLLWLPTNWMATTGRAIGRASSLFITLKKLPYSHLLPAASSITYKAHHAMHMVSQEWYVASQGCLCSLLMSRHSGSESVRKPWCSSLAALMSWLPWLCMLRRLNKICTSGPYSSPLLRC